MIKKAYGFTIVELLIVIVVIGILAALAMVSYNNVSAKAHDSERMQEIKSITKALEMYYVHNGEYPPSSGSTTINTSWSASADSSWANLASHLKPYIEELPVDPVNSGSGLSSSSHGYAYYSNVPGGTLFCGVSGPRQFYILTYSLVGNERQRVTSGSCTGAELGPGYRDYYRAVR